MQLFTTTRAPNPRRVAMFMADKGIALATREVSLRSGEHQGDELRELNPDCTLPFLALDDGTIIGESLAICRFLEAAHPDPPLFGTTPREQGLVEMWLRILEFQGYLPVQDAYRNSRPGFAGRALPGHRAGVAQIPALVERANLVYARTLARLDARLADQPFVVDTYSMADIVAFISLDFAQRTRMEVAADLGDWPHLRAWFERMATRPSALAGLDTA